MEHGALQYLECVGEDLNPKMASTFPKMLKSKPGETVFFSYVVYKSRADRDRINKKVMTDPRLAKMMKDKPPFDVKRMAYGGFKPVVKF
jgi:uncharacterized protein YbaA (DUF1428 family)